MVRILKTEKGNPLPFGATQQKNGINFALVAKQASNVTLLLYALNKKQILTEIPLDPNVNKTGDVWHVFVPLDPRKVIGYAYRIEGPTQETELSFYDPTKILLDPYAKAVNTPTKWGSISCGKKEEYQPIGLYLPPHDFDWENDRPPNIKPKDLIIYEMHVRGFTQHCSSGVKAPGTFLGVIEKIPHLLELGVNAIELMPIQEFNECEYKVHNPHIHETLYQFWGYSTVNFFSPMNRYVFGEEPGAGVDEFKKMVKALHKNGISVILDVVFNHTNEGNEKGPTNSFKGIDSRTYYMMDKEGKFMNFTGCGNTVNANQPIVQNLILDALRYWVLEMHVDGFRFDLASIFSRGTQGEVLGAAPLIEAISKDPILSKTLLIAEPWDASGLYQVGGFYPKDARWIEWNARYRDTLRRFIKGNPNVKGKFATRLCGSEDLYHDRSPICSLNFIVAHDGFTLHDLVSYNQKHNLSNGESNRDGENNNESWNCGREGLTHDPVIQDLRQRQMRNFHLALMLSQGIPMILMGDEYGHTKKGNNNTWCHDNELNWFLWQKLQDQENFYRYYRLLIQFRKNHPILHQGRFLKEDDISWWDPEARKASWDKDTHFLAFTLYDKASGNDLYAAFNAQNIELDVQLPKIKDHQTWTLIVNTSNKAPDDFNEIGPPVNGSIHMLPYSSVLLEAKPL